MKKYFISARLQLTLLFLVLFIGIICIAQNVAINNTGAAPSGNAMLDVQSSSKGILIPRIDYNNRPTNSVENGMLIFVTANGPLGNNFFYYYDGTKWLRVKNSDDKQSLTLSHDTLQISESNYVVVGNILNLIGYYKCGTSYTQVSSDLNNCGLCGNVCNTTNGTAYCTGGACGIACNAGFGNCNNNANDGCEINLNTSVSNCGSCGNVCSGANATSFSCSAGACAIGSCNAGFGNCDGNATNGCEINLMTSLNNCGACGNVCSGANATSFSCTAGACAIGSCNAGFGNCDGNAINGCEINLITSLNNCGACGNVCSGANATSFSCSAGACTISSCNAGFGNCDGNAANGCEINLMTSLNNCGSCGNVCSGANATSFSCTAGACAISSCNAGFGNCDGNAANGCEINLMTSLNNCGACGNVCSGVNATSFSCSAGACAIGSCNAGFGNCDGNAANGCEINLMTSLNNCGACGNVCSGANATSFSCSAGACTISSCNAGFGNCDGNAANGCEINLMTSLNNCGACGNVCSGVNATSFSCSAGACAIGSCNAGFGNCDGNAANGCEINLNTSVNNCGTCGHVCSGGQSCVSGVCN